MRVQPAEGILRRHVTEIDTEMARLADRAQLLKMLADMPGPDCPDPLPGTWCPARFRKANGQWAHFRRATARSG